MERKEHRQQLLEIAENIRNICGSEGIKYLKDMAEVMIQRNHRDLEDASGDEVLIIQGMIKGHRELVKNLHRDKKS